MGKAWERETDIARGCSVGEKGGGGGEDVASVESIAVFLFGNKSVLLDFVDAAHVRFEKAENSVIGGDVIIVTVPMDDGLSFRADSRIDHA